MENDLYRKELASFKMYVPGKSIEEAKAEFGLKTVEKLASNENPLGPSPKAVAEIRKQVEMIHLYPDPTAAELREKLAGKLGVEAGQIVVANGGEQILQLIAQTFVNEGDEAIMADATFDVYASSVSYLGGIPVRVPLAAYRHDVPGFLQKVTARTKLLYVCNPNNPTGNIISAEELRSLAEALPDRVVLVLDEAYYDYAKVNPDYPDSLALLAKRANTVILRTFSKVAGIAGVRIGYAVTSAEIAGQMGKIKPTFNVNRLAQAAALGAADDAEHIAKTVDLNYRSLGMMEEYFEKKGLEYIKSSTNFVFVNTGIDSRLVFQELMKRGVIIRPGFNWGFDNWIRVSSGTSGQTRIFLEKLEEILGEVPE